MHLDTMEQRMVDQFRTDLERELRHRLKTLKVFGSRARGTARPSSDLDVFVLVDRYDRATRKLVVNLAEDINEAVDFRIVLSPLVMDVAEYERLKAHERRLVRDIEAEGIPV